MKQGASGGFRWAAMGWLVVAALTSRADMVASTSGSLFNPGDAAFAGATQSLSLTSGSITFNTDTGAITGALPGINPSDYFYQGQSQSGQVSLGVFVFDSINLPQGVTITVTGSQGFVLASRHDLTLGTSLQLNGGNAPTLSANGSGAGGIGAPGSEGGNAGSATNSAPPALNHGDGGKGGYANSGSASSRAMNGRGTGGGTAMSGASSPSTTFGGGGGGYGDKGGKAGTSTGSSSSAALGGASYGADTLDDLFGGSGGGGSEKNGSPSLPSSHAMAGGGGGGGAVELISLGPLNLSGAVEAKGGNGGGSSRTSGTNAAGGGGSGGGIIVAANNLQLSGSVDASGGNSGALAGGTKIEGGGGAGGRIALYYNALTQAPDAAISVGFGTSGISSLNGLSGTTYNAGSGSFPFQPVSTPELSSFCLALVGALPVLARRRPR